MSEYNIKPIDEESRMIMRLTVECTDLRNLLDAERMAHRQTRQKLEKADRDRKRYARRIRFEAGRHAMLCRSFHALEVENKTLNGCVTQLERRLFDGTCGEAADGTPPASGEQEKNG